MTQSQKRSARSGALFVGPCEQPDEYELVTQLGSGRTGQGRVYLARFRAGWSGRSLRSCAVKVRTRSPREMTETAEHAERTWIRQSVDAASCSHPGLVPVIDAFVGPPPHRAGAARSGEDLYFVTAYQPGVQLDAWRSNQQRTVPSVLGAMLDAVGLHGAARWSRARLQPSARHLVRPVRQVAGGLDALHHAGLAHADVKPANIIVERSQGVLVDYGSLLRIGRRPVAVTMSYTPPERYIGQVAGDRFSLACVVFFLLSGVGPTLGRRAGEGPDVEGMLRSLRTNPLLRRHPAVERVMAEALVLPDSDPPLPPGAVGQWVRDLTDAVAGRARTLEQVRGIRPALLLQSVSRRVARRGWPDWRWFAGLGGISAFAVLSLLTGLVAWALAAAAVGLVLWWVLSGPRSRLAALAVVGAIAAVVLLVVNVASWVRSPETDAPSTDVRPGGSPAEGVAEPATNPFFSDGESLPGRVLLGQGAFIGADARLVEQLVAADRGVELSVERFAYRGSESGLTVSVEPQITNRTTGRLDASAPRFALLVGGSIDAPWQLADLPGLVSTVGADGDGGIRALDPGAASLLAVAPVLDRRDLRDEAVPVGRWLTTWSPGALDSGASHGGPAADGDRMTFSVPAPDEGDLRLVGLMLLSRSGALTAFSASTEWEGDADPFTFDVAGDAVHESALRPGECVADVDPDNPYRVVVPCSSPHRAEVAAQLAGGEIDQDLRPPSASEADGDCRAVLDELTGRGAPGVQAAARVPSPAEWETGPSYVTCYAVAVDGSLSVPLDE